MKVICIDGKPNTASFSLPEGVILDARIDIEDTDFFFIAGYETDPVDGRLVTWHERRFIPISSIDETELEREYNTQTLNLKS